MSKAIILKFTIFCLLLQPIGAYEVKTHAQTVEKSTNQSHYPDFAKRFSETLLTHPTVYDCHVELHAKEYNEVYSHIDIAIEIDKYALHSYLNEAHNKSDITRIDEIKYLHDLKVTVQKSAHETFSEIKIDAIKVSITMK